LIADVELPRRKQMAKTLIKFSGRHPKLRFSRFVIPQVPGSMRAVRLCTGWWNPSSSRRSTSFQRGGESDLRGLRGGCLRGQQVRGVLIRRGRLWYSTPSARWKRRSAPRIADLIREN